MAAMGQADMQFAPGEQFAHVAPATTRRPDAGEVDRAVADIVISVAAEILGREFPVARDQPLLHAAEYLGLALAPVPAIELQIEKACRFAEIFEKGRRRGIPIRPDRALVHRELRHFDKAPLRAVDLRVIGLAEKRHPDKPPVCPLAPTMIGTGEDRGVALIVAAYFHAAVTAGIQKHVHLAGAVTAQDHRFLTHPPRGVIAGIGDLALMSDKEPGAGEDLFLLLGVDLLVDKDLAADLPGLYIDQPRPVS